jgi:type IV secretion system protein VirB10
MLLRRLILTLAISIAPCASWAQGAEDVARPAQAAPGGQRGETQPADAAKAEPGGFKHVEAAHATSEFVVPPGTRILLNMINSVSTRRAAVGDRLYLQTAFPIFSNGRLVIPQGSWVAGSITQVKRPGRVKGRGELYVRFDSLTLPNGVSRDFRARVGSMDGRSAEEVDREEGKIKAEGNKGGDARTVADTTITGTGVGALAGVAAGHSGMGAGIGAAAGAGAGLLGVLMSRGPDATLTKGTTMEMVLDRSLSFSPSELDFSHIVPTAPLAEGSPEQRQPANSHRGWSPF